jgi:hypothetical protein
VIDVGQARAMALALPEAVEQDHHGMPSFRVRGRIFATLPDADTLRVMLDPDAVEEAVAAAPGQCSVLLWGAKVSGVAVHLPAADADTLSDLLADAWRRRAPGTLRRPFDAGRTTPDEAR